MLGVERRIKEVRSDRSRRPADAILRSSEPVIIRGLVADWPAAQAAERSSGDAIGYFRRFCGEATVAVSHGAGGGDRRVFYNDDLSGFNFAMERRRLSEVLALLQERCDDEDAPLCYVGSTTLDKCLPGLSDENHVLLDVPDPLASVWIGNRARIAAHFDVLDNLACVAAGRRRFILFPPDQVGNLYVGPLDFTPAGQPVSLADPRHCDDDRFPLFREALKHARTGELGPGDAIFIPSMWWHYVESLDAFNVLINYWWRTSPAYMGNPMDVLTHALLSIRDLPAAEREAWRGLLAHYVFDWDERSAAHIPESARGALAPVDDDGARRLRAALLKRLNR